MRHWRGKDYDFSLLWTICIITYDVIISRKYSAERGAMILTYFFGSFSNSRDSIEANPS